MRITFHGAARSVTGSRHLVEAAGRRILLDFGLVQGHRDEADRRNRETVIDPSGLDAVVLSHAHIDHSGALPVLVRQAFAGRFTPPRRRPGSLSRCCATPAICRKRTRSSPTNGWPEGGPTVRGGNLSIPKKTRSMPFALSPAIPTTSRSSRPRTHRHLS